MFTPRRTLAAFVSALAVSLITQVSTVLVYYIGHTFEAEMLSQATNFFFLSSLFLFVFVFLASILGLLRIRYIALVVGLVSGLLAALLGILIQFAVQGGGFGPSVFFVLFQSFITVNLIFIVIAVIATVTAGSYLWNQFVPRTPQPRKLALVRAPAASLAQGLVTHIKKKKVNTELADEQWDNYVAALTHAGWQVLEVEPRDDLADSVFVEDTVVMLGNVAVITLPGADSRKPEIEATERILRELGYPIRKITAPGALDGGDVLKVGSTIYIGRGGRTNAEGIRQFRAIAQSLGYTVVAVPVTKALHLKTAVTALPDGTVIGYPPLVDEPRVFERFLPVPEEHGTAVVVLSEDTVLMSASAPKSADLFRELGYQVITVDISEFEKLEGCVTCLSVRLRKTPKA